MKIRSLWMAGLVVAALGLSGMAQVSPVCTPFTRGAPQGGQPNTPGSNLTQTAFQQGTGPLEYWGPGGASVTSTHSGTPGASILLVLGTPSTGFGVVPGLGSIDVNLTAPLFPIYDGIGLFTAPDGSTAPLSLPYALPTGITAYLASAQGVTLDPASPVGATLTARNDVGVQNLASLTAPRMPPFTTPAGVTPVPPSTSIVYPYPRDTICPNIGVPSTSVGANNGTLMSALGLNFDATSPGATTATVNGLPVDVFAVRPNELFFYLNATHVPGVAGVLIVTSTGGTYTPPADQMNSWVHVIPAPLASLPTEVPGGGGLTVSGTFAGSPGLQAIIGTRGGIGEVDYYDATAIGPGQTVRVYLGQIDLASGQVLTQCSGLPSTPPARCDVCNTTGDGQFSQQWYANPCPATISPAGNNLRADMWLHHGIGVPGVPILGAFLADPDDSGPGTNSFAGMSGIPASATQPAFDPDGPFVTIGNDFFVSDEFANPQAPLANYNYIMIIHY
jgi:hypothetical protein